MTEATCLAVLAFVLAPDCHQPSIAGQADLGSEKYGMVGLYLFGLDHGLYDTLSVLLGSMAILLKHDTKG